MPLTTEHKHIILFDGVCNLCNGAVQFVIKRDPQATFSFAALQSEAGQTLLKKFDLSTDDFDTFVYIRGSECFTKSTAALKVCKKLGRLWQLLYAFIIIPPVIRDALYNVVVRNRYKWFGERETCMVPRTELQNRFL